MKKGNYFRKYLFIILLLNGWFLFSNTSFSQSIDTRTYSEISSSIKKNVIDYFLLCPDIYFVNADNYNPAHLVVLNPKQVKNTLSISENNKALEFRKALLKLGKLNNEIIINESIIDIPNGYIKLKGKDNLTRFFEIVFVVFEKPGKVIIPALSYHYEATEEITNNWVFYDITNNKWSPIEEKNFLPAFSLSDFKDVVPESEIRKIPPERIEWKLELPRYGTAIKIIPTVNMMEQTPAESDRLESIYQLFENYVLESSWILPEGKFSSVTLTLNDKSLLPKTGAITASSAFVILPANAFDNLSETISLENRKELISKSRIESTYFVYEFKNVSSNVIEIKSSSKTAAPSNESVKISFLGSSQNSDLFVVYQRNEQAEDFKIWTINRKNGLVAKTQFNPKPLKSDFYKTNTQINSEEPYLSYNLVDDGIKIELNTFRSQESVEPDYYLFYKWNGTSWSLNKTLIQK